MAILSPQSLRRIIFWPWVACVVLTSLSCAGQFELDVPDDHPARATARGRPIEPAPSPYEQLYPTDLKDDEGVERRSVGGEHPVDSESEDEAMP